MTKSEIIKRIDALKPWFHSIDLGDGIRIQRDPVHGAETNYPEALWKTVKKLLPGNVQGLRVLDVGCNAGYFSVEMKRAGASYVLGIEGFSQYLAQAKLVRDILQIDLDLRELNVYQVTEDLGRFDITLFLGVLYHLKHPLLALEILASVTEGILVVESAILPDSPSSNLRVNDYGGATHELRFLSNQPVGDEPGVVGLQNWFIPSLDCLKAFLQTVGFEHIVAESIKDDRAIVVASRGERAVPVAPKSHVIKELTSTLLGQSQVATNGTSEPPLLPLPPDEMRALVTTAGVNHFDNPTRKPIFSDIPLHQYETVFDFGCGCGRLARQLLQQIPSPRKYVGIDLHLGMIKWCQENLQPRATGFEFIHHDVNEIVFNPGENKARVLPFPVQDSSFKLVIAASVFTHLLEEQTEYYLKEVARILDPNGVFVSTWFLFDKRYFPMMQDFQNALFINLTHPANAVVVDANWLQQIVKEVGLKIVQVYLPPIRGFQWQVHMVPRNSDRVEVDFPEDSAPFGSYDEIVRSGR
jgi:2-polyprenyl-3-methyl-5-hydroxy-6-metoxy-1,4-benzoquinol methylase